MRMAALELLVQNHRKSEVRHEPAIRAKGAGKKAFVNARLLDPVNQTDAPAGHD